MTSSRLGPAWWALCLGVAAGLLTATLGSLRLAGWVLAVTMLGTAALRLVLPKDAAGGIAVRSRGVDVLMYAGMAVAVALMFGMVKLSAFGG